MTRLRDQIAFIMSDGEWRTPFEIRDYLLIRFHRHASDSGITAKLRQLRDVKYGGHSVPSRRRRGERAQVWEYRMDVPQPEEGQLALEMA